MASFKQVVGAMSIGVVALAATAACSSNSSSDTSSATWKIGVEAPLTGDQSNLGLGMLQGAQLAAEQLNSAGGVLGRKIEIIQIDDAANATTGVAAANSAISQGLNGVVGPYNSSVGAQTLPLYLKAGVVPIRLTSDNSTDGMGFTLQPMTSQIAPVTANALSKFYKAKSVGIIYDSSQNYTKSTSAAVKADLEKAGVKVTSYQAITPGQGSYADTLQQVSAKNPDMIYSAVYYPEGAKIAQEITPKTAGNSNYRCLLDYASYDSGYITNAGQAAAQRCNVVGVPAPTDFSGSADKVAAFQQQFKQPPGTWSPYTYDSLNFLIDGAKAVGSFNSAQLTSHLSTVKQWQGWTGTVSIEPRSGNREPATVVVTVVTDGEFHVNAAWAQAVGAPY
ncbi:MAG: branched-chain amino acid ABC transporter substrate-binding protein [Candidatus Nanopelagicales bacterium]